MSMLPTPMGMPAVGGYAPLATGSAYQHFNMFGNAFGHGMAGMGMQMLAQPYLQQAMSQQGMFPLGFGHSQNMYDVAQRLRFQQMYERSLNESRQAEAQVMMQSMRGMAHLAGTPWNLSTMNSATALSNFLARGAPIMAQVAPDLLESLGGRVGSATLLQHNLVMGGRYRLDPVTGQMGMSAESASRMRDEIMGMYNTGDATRMFGVTAGRAGQMFDELTRRGLTPSFDRSTALRSLGHDIGGLSGADVDKLALKPEVSAQLRAFDAKKVKDTIQKYSQTITAMREIFGDNGHPNAPMSQLLQSLDEMTMGGMSQFDPGKLTSIVRSTHNLAKAAGIPMEMAQQMTLQGAVFAHQMGLNPVFGPQIAQGGMAFYGGLQGLVPTFGMLDRSGLAQLDMTKRAGASGSRIANQLATLMRLRESRGGFAAGTQAETIARAIERGDTLDSMHMTETEFAATMQAAGVTPGAVRSAVTQTVSNEEFLHRFNIGAITRPLQTLDAKATTQQHLRNSIFTQLREKNPGMSQQEAERLADKAAAAGANALFGMSRDAMSKPIERSRILGQAIHTATGGAIGGDTGTVGSLAFGALEQAVPGGAFGPNLKNFVNVLEAHRPENVAAATKQMKLDAARQLIQTPLSRFAAPDSILGNLIGGLQGMKKGMTMEDYILKVTGGVKLGEVGQALGPQLQKLKDLQNRFETAFADYEKDQSPANHAKLVAIRDELTRADAENPGVLKALEDIKGIGDLYNTMGPKVTAEARNAIKDFHEARTIFRDRNLSAKDREKFWGSASGKLMREYVGNMMGSTNNLLASAISGDDFIMKKGGRRGLEAARQLMTGRDQLQRLADKYAGGDVAKLAAGDLSGVPAEDREAVRHAARMAHQDIKEGTEALSRMDAGPVNANIAKDKALQTDLADLRNRQDPKELMRQLLLKRGIAKEDAEDLIKSGKLDAGIKALGSGEKTMRDMRLILEGGNRAGQKDLMGDGGELLGGGGPAAQAKLMEQKIIKMAEDEVKKKKEADEKVADAGSSSMKVTGELVLRVADGKGELRNVSGKTLKFAGPADAAAHA